MFCTSCVASIPKVFIGTECPHCNCVLPDRTPSPSPSKLELKTTPTKKKKQAEDEPPREDLATTVVMWWVAPTETKPVQQLELSKRALKNQFEKNEDKKEKRKENEKVKTKEKAEEKKEKKEKIKKKKKEEKKEKNKNGQGKVVIEIDSDDETPEKPSAKPAKSTEGTTKNAKKNAPMEGAKGAEASKPNAKAAGKGNIQTPKMSMELSKRAEGIKSHTKPNKIEKSTPKMSMELSKRAEDLKSPPKPNGKQEKETTEASKRPQQPDQLEKKPKEKPTVEKAAKPSEGKSKSLQGKKSEVGNAKTGSKIAPKPMGGLELSKRADKDSKKVAPDTKAKPADSKNSTKTAKSSKATAEAAGKLQSNSLPLPLNLDVSKKDNSAAGKQTEKEKEKEKGEDKENVNISITQEITGVNGTSNRDRKRKLKELSPTITKNDPAPKKLALAGNYPTSTETTAIEPPAPVAAPLPPVGEVSNTISLIDEPEEEQKASSNLPISMESAKSEEEIQRNLQSQSETGETPVNSTSLDFIRIGEETANECEEKELQEEPPRALRRLRRSRAASGNQQKVKNLKEGNDKESLSEEEEKHVISGDENVDEDENEEEGDDIEEGLDYVVDRQPRQPIIVTQLFLNKIKNALCTSKGLSSEETKFVIKCIKYYKNSKEMGMSHSNNFELNEEENEEGGGIDLIESDEEDDESEADSEDLNFINDEAVEVDSDVAMEEEEEDAFTSDSEVHVDDLRTYF